MEVLQRRQPKTCINPNRCVMCHSHYETSDHLFVNCRATNFLWDTLRAQTGYQHSFNNLKSVALSLLHHNFSTRRNIIITKATVAVLWSIWTERNRRIFVIKQNSLLNLWEDCCNYIDLWGSRHHLFKDYSSISLALNFSALLHEELLGFSLALCTFLDF